MQLLQITEWVTATKYWIGLDDLENEGSFVWESGRLLSASFGRDHWADNQPNGTPSDAATLDDHCICVGCFGPKMWDTVCENAHRFVCQKLPSCKLPLSIEPLAFMIKVIYLCSTKYHKEDRRNRNDHAGNIW